jgi:hypothetical protein
VKGQDTRDGVARRSLAAADRGKLEGKRETESATMTKLERGIDVTFQ